MDELELYEQILDLSSPWSVELVQLDKDTKNLDVFVSCDADTQLFCPKCACQVLDTIFVNVRGGIWILVSTQLSFMSAFLVLNVILMVLYS
jgi:hypothetical protein